MEQLCQYNNKDFSLLQIVQTDSGTRPTGCCFPGGKAAGAEAGIRVLPRLRMSISSNGMRQDILTIYTGLSVTQ